MRDDVQDAPDGEIGGKPRRAWLPLALLLLAATYVSFPASSRVGYFALSYWSLLLLAWALLLFLLRLHVRDSWMTLPKVLVIAAVLRCLVMPLEGELSDDIYRYIWDGRVLSAGWNPYLTTPNDPTFVSLRDDLWQVVAHRDVPTVYPPLSQAFFLLASLLPFPLLSFKLLIVIVELFGCWALWLCAQRLAVDPARIVLYAWNPLVVLEGAGMGHVDLIGVPFVTLALCLLLAPKVSRHSAIAAGCAAAAGVLIKLVPLVALTSWFAMARQKGRALGYAAGTAVTLGLVSLPVLTTTGLPPGLVRYGVSWEFNGPLFEPLWRLIAVFSFDQYIKGLIPLAERFVAFDSARLYSLVYPQLLAKGVLALLFLVLFLHAALRKPPLAALHRSLAAAMLCFATLYPWYLTWVLPTAILLGRWHWLALSASIQLAYLPRLFGVAYWPMTYLAVWVPFLIAYAVVQRTDPSEVGPPSEDSRSSNRPGSPVS